MNVLQSLVKTFRFLKYFVIIRYSVSFAAWCGRSSFNKIESSESKIKKQTFSITILRSRQNLQLVANKLGFWRSFYTGVQKITLFAKFSGIVSQKFARFAIYVHVYISRYVSRSTLL